MKKTNLRIAAAALCALLTCGFGAHAAPTIPASPAIPAAQDVPAKPSVPAKPAAPALEMTVDLAARTFTVQSIRADGTTLVQETTLADSSQKTLDDTVRQTLAAFSKQGYWGTAARGSLVIVTAGKDARAAAALAEHLETLAAKQCAAGKHRVTVEAEHLTDAQLALAKTNNVTPGKLVMVLELQEEYRGAQPFPTEQWLKKSAQDILAETARLDTINDKNEQDKDDDADDKDDDVDDAADAADDAADAADAAEDAAEAAEDADEDAKDAADAADDAADAAEDAAEAAEDADEDAKDAAEDAADAAADADADATDAADDDADDDAAANDADDDADANDDAGDDADTDDDA